jgi:hypothetical protein
MALDPAEIRSLAAVTSSIRPQPEALVKRSENLALPQLWRAAWNALGVGIPACRVPFGRAFVPASKKAGWKGRLASLETHPTF